MAFQIDVSVQDTIEVQVLTERMRDPGPLLRQVGRMMAGRMRSAFQKQGRGDTEWPPRATPSIPGIAQDLKSGPTVKARRFDGRPALVITGQLANSLSFRFSGRRAVEVGTTVPYATLQNFGGTSRITVTDRIRRNLETWLQGKNEGLKKLLRQAIGQQDEVVTDVRPRPFVEVTDRDRRDIEQLTREFFSGAQVSIRG